MPRLYAATYNGTITAAGTNSDLGSFQPADDKPIRLRGILFSQSSEVGDAAEEGLRITVNRLPATFTVGSGGAAITATTPSSDPLGVVWGFTGRANDTTIATTSGTAEAHFDSNWNIRNSPYDFFWPDERFCVAAAQGAGIVVRLDTTPADDFVGSFTFWVEEP